MANKTGEPIRSLQPLETSRQKKPSFNLAYRLLLALLPLVAVGVALYGFLTSPLRLVQPENAGSTPLAREIGQQVQMEHTGLRSIKVRTPKEMSTEELQLHLREPEGKLDLRVSRAKDKAADGWVGFDFAPLEATYKDRTLFFFLEASGLPFQLVWNGSNVYPKGESYLDGVKQNGDLSFELEYNPDPAGLFATYFERQSAYNGLAWAGLVALVLWLGLAGLGSILLVLRPTFFSTEYLKEMVARQFWPIALYFLLLGAAGGLAFIFLTPPLQGLDEQGHVGRTVFVYQYNAEPSSYPPLFQATWELEKQARYLEYLPGFSYDQPALTFSNYSPLSENHQPPIYYAVAGGIVRLGSWLTGQHHLLFQLYLTRLTSLLFSLGALAIVLGWAYYLRREAAWLMWVVPGAYALLPTNLYISGVANNDNAVNFFIPLLLLCLTVLYKEGSTLRYRLTFWRKWWPLVVIGLGSAVLSYLSKSTCGVFLGGLACGVFIYSWVWTNRRLRLGLLCGLGLLILVFGFVLVFKSPWQWAVLLDFLKNTNPQNRPLIAVQVLILTFESFWCSAGWVNFSGAGQGRLMLGLFVLTLLVFAGLGRFLIGIRYWVSGIGYQVSGKG
ncbi:MAG: DUF2142 domain-containing protein, partial [Chloroflexota bacterium]